MATINHEELINMVIPTNKYNYMVFMKICDFCKTNDLTIVTHYLVENCDELFVIKVGDPKRLNFYLDLLNTTFDPKYYVEPPPKQPHRFSRFF